MRLDDLFQPTANDIILREAILTSKSTQDREYITELAFIPILLWAGGIAWTAYDARQVIKSYQRGDISQSEMIKLIGTDLAITAAAGGAAKLAGKGYRVGKNIYKTRKAAKIAEKEAAAALAAKVNAQVATYAADAPKVTAAAATAIKSKVADAVSKASPATVKVIKKIDKAYDKVDSKLDVDVPSGASDIVTKVVPHSTAAVVSPTVKTVKKVVNKVDQKKIDDLHHADNVANIKKTNIKNKLHPTNATPAAATTSKVTSKVAKNADDVVKKNVDDVVTHGTAAVTKATTKATKKAIEKNAKKKADDLKRKKKGKKWRMGGAGGKGTMYDTGFRQFVDKYAKY